uniref:Endoglucanase n=1 Tax=Tanacetum cinerariifolium TaxID=118510 RepID=A0A6L2NYA6_TANCI|nr:endoglucanase 24-like [Tanacetum cinerariifolium]
MFANWDNPTWFSWDNKLAGTQVLLSRVNFFGIKKEISMVENMNLQMYRRTAEALMCLTLLPPVTSQKTNGGLIWVNEWDTLQYSIATSFLAVVFSDYMFTSNTPYIYCNGKLFEPINLREFAISQADYVLGNNPMNMSYLVGFGRNYPQYVHHRGASIPIDANTSCKDGFMWLNSTKPNPNVAVGAVVGGPFLNDTYIDSRNNSMQGMVNPISWLNPNSSSARLSKLWNPLCCSQDMGKTYLLLISPIDLLRPIMYCFMYVWFIKKGGGGGEGLKKRWMRWR